MKYLPLLAIALLFNTSCGIFKKKSTYFKTKEGYEITSNLEVKSNLKTLESSETLDKSKLEVKSKNRWVIYPSKNTETVINEDGSIVGGIDSIVKDITETTEEVKNILTKLNKQTEAKKDSTSGKKEEAQKEEVKKEKTKTPDKGSILIIGIVTGLIIVIVIIVLLRRR